MTSLSLPYLLQEGTSNYFKGLMLILGYLIVAASFYVHVDLSNGELLKKNNYKKKKRTLHTESNMQYIFPIKIKYEIQLVNWLSTCVTFDTDD